MSAPTKKAAAKKRAPRAASTPAPEVVEPELSDEDLTALADDDQAADDEGPVVIGKRGRRGQARIEMETIFVLGDRHYQIPKNPSAALVLSWLLDTQKYGEGIANQRMGVELLGEQSLRALAASPEVEPEDLYRIFGKIARVFFTSENYRKITEAPDPS